MRNDILTRLQMDPGHRTLGQLLQDREAAIHEIQRLTRELSTSNKMPQRAVALEGVAPGQKPTECQLKPFRTGALIRAGEVCELMAISRATFHRLRLLKNFPKPVLLGPNTKRWKIEEILAWEFMQST